MVGRMNHVNLLGASLAVVFGFVLAAYLDMYLIALLCAAASFACYMLPDKQKKQGSVYFLICILAILYFHLYDHFHRSSLITLAGQEATISIHGIIDSPVKQDGDVVRYFLLVDQYDGKSGDSVTVSPRERIALRVKLSEEKQLDTVESWREGNQFNGRVKLSLPEPVRNPHAFDYRAYLRWQAVYVTAETEYQNVTVDTASGNLFTFFQQWQTVAANKVREAFPDQETAGYMLSLLLGLQDGVSPEVEQMYSDVGLIHVLAISGLHVTLVSAFFLWFMERLGMSRERALLTVILFVVLYVLIVGASPSAIRSGLMGIAALALRYKRKQLPSLALWAGALLLMLLINPYQLWQVGFQLSFAVTLGLLLYTPLFMNMPHPKWLWLKSLIAVTTAAQLISFPFLIYWFHQASMISWLINLLAVPALSFIVLPLGYFTLLAAFVHPALAIVPGRLTSYFLYLIHLPIKTSTEVFVPFSFWPHPHVTWLVFYGLFVSVIPLLWIKGFHRRRDILGYLVIFFILAVLARHPFDGQEEVRITFLDVGQGDSIVVEVAKKTVYLIDGGGTVSFPNKEKWRMRRDPFEVGKDVVLPFLRSRGIQHIDKLVLTHGDHDHIGGIPAVLSHLQIDSALVNGEAPEELEAEIVAQLERKGTAVLTGHSQISWSDMPGVRWTWLSPTEETEESGNNRSIVLLLSVYGTNILFTGDLEQPGEERLLSKGSLPVIDVLKVAHHGSRSSSTLAFLQTIKPKAAVISVGQNNKYGHPSAEVLQRLKDNNVEMFRTDRQGAITLIVRPQELIWIPEISF